MNTYLGTPNFELVGRNVISNTTGRKGEIISSNESKSTLKVSWKEESDGAKICKWVGGKIVEKPVISTVKVKSVKIL